MAKARFVTDQEIEDGLDFVAELIDRLGDVYWPVFDRLERELEARKSRSEKLRARLRQNKKKQDRASEPLSSVRGV